MRTILDHKFIRYWLPVLLIAGGIFYSSSTPYGDQDIRPQLNQLNGMYSFVEQFDFVHFTYAGKEISIHHLGSAGFVEFFIRKLAHFSVFCLLAFFTTRLVSVYRQKFFISGLVLTILYAASDEFHQSFTADRTPLIQDVIIDSCGALVGACLFFILYNKFYKKK